MAHHENVGGIDGHRSWSLARGHYMGKPFSINPSLFPLHFSPHFCISDLALSSSLLAISSTSHPSDPENRNKVINHFAKPSET